MSSCSMDYAKYASKVSNRITFIQSFAIEGITWTSNTLEARLLERSLAILIVLCLKEWDSYRKTRWPTPSLRAPRGVGLGRARWYFRVLHPMPCLRLTNVVLKPLVGSNLIKQSIFWGLQSTTNVEECREKAAAVAVAAATLFCSWWL